MRTTNVAIDPVHRGTSSCPAGCPCDLVQLLHGSHRGRPSARRQTAMREIQLSAGTIEYLDAGGDGPVIVLVSD